MVFEPLINRTRSPKSRVHLELTQDARERILSVTSVFDFEIIDGAFGLLTEEIPRSKMADYLNGNTSQEHHNSFIMNGETKQVFTYIELILKVADNSKEHIGIPKYSSSNIQERAKKIQKILIEEGILWEVKKDEANTYIFDRVESERMKESDNELRKISLEIGEEWREALEGYNEAFRLYKEGKYSKDILESLYLSVEEIVKIICVDERDWEENREMNLSNYLETMRKQDFFEANNIMRSEIETLTQFMEKTFSKLGNDRKNRHNPNIDRYYCNLLIHQTSAFLYYLIKRQQQN